MTLAHQLLLGPSTRGGYATPREQRLRRLRTLWILLVAALGLLVFTLLDRPIWLALTPHTAEKIDQIKGRDWWQALRAAGYLPTWIAVGLLLMLHDRTAGLTGVMSAVSRHMLSWWRRGLLVFLGAGLGGLAAEILKGVSRRERPGPDGIYAFDYLGMGRDHVGLGLASSHAGTAFGACVMLGWLFPAVRWPLLLLAAGCAFTRLRVGAHWTTDVYVAILLSYGVCLVLWRTLGPGRPGQSLAVAR